MNKDYNFGEDVRLVVGDEKQPVFYPRMKIKRWDNEVNFSVGLISEHIGKYSITDGEVEWEDEHGIKAKFYEKEDNEFEFEIELEEKPESNVIHFSIETKGLDFFYQPELTEVEKNEVIVADDGSAHPVYTRPDDIIGSYAVYHNNKKGNIVDGNKYRAGKFCHIYRPYATDSNGWEVWCDLNIQDDMQITIPQHFIDNAVYPIIVDPTFGCNPASPGGSSHNLADDMAGSVFTSPTDVGTADSLTCSASRDQVGDGKCALVLHSNLEIVENGIGSNNLFTWEQLWYTSTFSTPPSLSASTEYVLCLAAHGFYHSTIYYDVGDTNQGHLDTSNSGDNPVDPTDAVHNNNLYSVYCTYTAGAPSGGSPAGKTLNGSLWGPFRGPI